MARPRVRVYTPLPPDVQTCWSLGDIDVAIRLHEDGDFYASAQLWDLLTRIGRVEGCTNTRVSALIAKGGAASFRVEPDRLAAKDAKAKKLALDVGGWWWSVFPDWVWRSILTNRIGLGLAYGTREWFAKDGRWFFHLNPWPLQHLRWNAQLDRYQVVTQQGLATIEPDDPSWWLYEPSGPRSWMRGAVRALGDLGHRRNDALMHWARYCKRHGTPILAIDEPHDVAEKEADAFFKKMQGSIAGGTVRLPQQKLAGGNKFGYDIRIVEPKAAEAWKTFQAFLEWISTEIAIRIKGQNLTTEVQGGSYAAAKQHGGTDLLLLASDAQELTTFAHRETHVWCAVNVPQHDPIRTPWPLWDTTEAEDAERLGKVLIALGQGVAAMRTGGMNPDRLDLCNRAGINLDPDEPLLDLADPAAPGEKGEGEGESEGEGDDGGDGQGDDPAPEGGGDDEGDDSAPKQPAKAGARRRVRAAGTTGGAVPAPPGALEGQAAIDQRAPEVAASAGAAMAPDVADLLVVVNGARTPEDLYAGILRAFEGQSPETLARALHQGMLFAELAGRFSMLTDQAHAAGEESPPGA